MAPDFDAPLEDTDESVADLGRLAHLQSLQLQHTAVTDAGLKHLGCLGELEELYLQGTRVTAAGVARLKTALPRLRVVCSHKSKLDDAA
ncbi:MAG: hypothetical protein ABFC96_06735 [Thermoguttaceae bacterium]